MKQSQQAAKFLGRLGGVSRARRLSAAKKGKIAAMGGHARGLSLQAGRRIAENFRYLETIHQLSKSRRQYGSLT